MTGPAGVPGGDPQLNEVSYARGVLEEEAKEYRRQRDQALATLDYLLTALDGGDYTEVDAAIHGATLTLKTLKDKT